MHTPDPWYIEHPYDEPGAYIGGPNTELVAAVYNEDDIDNYHSHPAAYGEDCPMCGAWEDEKTEVHCQPRQCPLIDVSTGFHREDTPVEQDGSCCACGMI